jgi:hypothetical protein
MAQAGTSTAPARPLLEGGAVAGDTGAAARPEALGAAEWAALEQLAASDGYATRWPVGRQVTRSLAARGLVVVASDYVLLTQAGRLALGVDGDVRRASRPAPPDLGRPDPGARVRPAPADPVVVTARRPVVGVASAG